MGEEGGGASTREDAQDSDEEDAGREDIRRWMRKIQRRRRRSASRTTCANVYRVGVDDDEEEDEDVRFDSVRRVSKLDTALLDYARRDAPRIRLRGRRRRISRGFRRSHWRRALLFRRGEHVLESTHDVAMFNVRRRPLLALLDLRRQSRNGVHHRRYPRPTTPRITFISYRSSSRSPPRADSSGQRSTRFRRERRDFDRRAQAKFARMCGVRRRRPRNRRHSLRRVRVRRTVHRATGYVEKRRFRRAFQLSRG